MATVAIIGAGISGLASADVLQRCGFTVTLFERAARVGGVWARAYDGVALQNIASQYHLSSFPWPFEPDLHPTGKQILRYLDAVVVAKRLDVRLEHEVLSARELVLGENDSGGGGRWELSTRHGDATHTSRFDHLLVSIGQYTEGKHRPVLEGEADFEGTVVTEREMRLDDVAGKKVVVVGFGKSALDAACFAAEAGAHVTHVFRTPRWTLPQTVFGVHFSRAFFGRVGSVMMPSWSHPTAVERAMHQVPQIPGTFWKGIEALVGHLARRGADAEGRARLAAVIPDHPLVPDLRSAAALAPVSYYPFVASGKIAAIRGEIARFSRRGVELEGGAEVEADLVVLAVGSKSPRFPFLAEEHRALLESEEDGVQLYRHLVHPQIPSLGFAGYNHGFMHVPAAEIGALWLSALWKGELVLPPVDEMNAAVEHVRSWKRDHIHFEPSRSCAINTRYQQYLDILLQDLGISPYRKLPNVLAEAFERYVCADYAGVVDEYARVSKPRRPLPLPT